jgi:hypothetical protein
MRRFIGNLCRWTRRGEAGCGGGRREPWRTGVEAGADFPCRNIKIFLCKRVNFALEVFCSQR